MTEEFRARVLKRSPHFQHLAQAQLQAFPELHSVAPFAPDAPLLLSQAYFLLNDAFKTRRGQVTLTDDYKKAAISAISVMTLRPFAVVDPENVKSNLAYFANPIFAVAVANSWLSTRNLLQHFPFDYLRRFYLSLMRIRMPSLEPFIEAVNNDGNYLEIERVSLTWTEVEDIDDWIYRFWLLANLKL